MNPDFLERLDLARAHALLDGDRAGAPERIGRYVVERSLGAGASGIVYLATDPRLGRPVVLKVLAPRLGADAEAVARFEAEARIASGLDHPRIAPVHDVGRDASGLVYIAMAYRDGVTLRERLRARSLTVAEAIAIAAEVAEGLAAAHAAGVVHRDVKPENILLTARGACLLDFGIATLAGEAAWQGSGTPAYMSPEQAAGGPVDARSDLWALGAVLYEMLTGRRTSAAGGTPAAPSTLRRGVPVPLDRLVLALLAPAPGDRPGSATEVRARLGGLAARRRGTLSLVAAFGLVAALALGAWALRRGGLPGPAPDAALVAVAPFEVLGPSLDTWREGVADLLAQDFDGAGPLRSVSPSLALPRWRGRADPASAERFGRELGAGLVVFGSVVRVGTDSVILRASVLDRTRGSLRRDVEVAGVEPRIGRLADSLALLLLDAMGRERPTGSPGVVLMGSRSLPALKAFLRGEQLYRERAWDSAAAAYFTAGTLDTTFGLAFDRLATVLDWGVPTAGRYARSVEYRRRAVALGYGPSGRARLQHTADSFGLLMFDRRDPQRLLRADSGMRQGYRDLLQRYPDDPGLWTNLGEILYHAVGAGGRDVAGARVAFSRALALDSGFTPAYEHAFGLALWAGDLAMARQLARASLARAQPGSEPAPMRLALTLLERGGASVAADSAVRTAAGGDLLTAAVDPLQWWPDSAESAVRLLAALTDPVAPPAQPATLLSPSGQALWHAFALTFRGHLAAAARAGTVELQRSHRRSLPDLRDPFIDLALLGALPDTLVARTFAAALTTDTPWNLTAGFPPPRELLGLPWWYQRGDTTAMEQFRRHALAIASHSDSARGVLRGRYLAPAAAAWLALARADTATALAGFRGLPDLLCAVGDCHFEKVKLAELLASRGADSSAAAILDRWGDARGPTATAVLARLLRGQIAERMGDRTGAARCYRLVLDAWRGADPALTAPVEAARAGLARVTGPGPG